MPVSNSAPRAGAALEAGGAGASAVAGGGGSAHAPAVGAVGIPGFPAPFWGAPGRAALYLGDVRARLRALPARSVHCVVTSPPYWGLRDYGTGTWEGGSTECGHEESTPSRTAVCRLSSTLDGSKETVHASHVFKAVCGRCGARRIDMQIGAEPSPDCGTGGQAQCGACFVCSLVTVFREVYRVLRDDGTCWLNLGDTFGGGKVGRTDLDRVGVDGFVGSTTGSQPFVKCGKSVLPPGNLVGVPWRVALALQADGWVLRQDIIWYSANKMPESVQNRCSKSHEHIFLLAKSGGYYFDAVAIAEPAKSKPHAPGNVKLSSDNGTSSLRNDITELSSTTKVWAADGIVNKRDVWIVSTESGQDTASHKKRRAGGAAFGKTANRGGAVDPGVQNREYDREDADLVNKRDTWTATDESPLAEWLLDAAPELVEEYNRQTASKRDVWVVPTQGYPGAHFAVYSPRLITPCILAGTSEHGCCAACGRPYERVVARVGAVKLDGQVEGHNRDRSLRDNRNGMDSTLDTGIAQRETAGWQKMCGCPTGEVVPAIVLDPFVGSGTTVATALQLGRRGVGVDLSETYLRENAVPRIEAALAGRAPRRATVVVPADAPPAPRRLRGAT